MSHKGHSHISRSSMVLFVWSGFHFMVGIGNLLVYEASQVWFDVHSLSYVWLHELQHARLPCPSPSPRVCPSSCPLNQWCHPLISSSASPFSSCPQSFPASVFSNELAIHIRWPKYWRFSISLSTFRWLTGKESACQCKRHGFNP